MGSINLNPVRKVLRVKPSEKCIIMVFFVCLQPGGVDISYSSLTITSLTPLACLRNSWVGEAGAGGSRTGEDRQYTVSNPPPAPSLHSPTQILSLSLSLSWSPSFPLSLSLSLFLSPTLSLARSLSLSLSVHSQAKRRGHHACKANHSPLSASCIYKRRYVGITGITTWHNTLNNWQTEDL